MGMEITLTNVFQFLSAISPLLLGFFMIMISIFNQDVKGLVYLGGILISIIINIFLINLVKNPRTPDKEAGLCNLINIPFGNVSAYNSPSLNSVLISFTMAYLLLPMKYNNQINYPLIVFLAAIFCMDGISKVLNNCTNPLGVILGLFVGFLLGSAWFILLHSTGNDSLLYFSEVSSNKVYCAKPNKQTFKCSVYKNGELIKTL